MSQNKKVYKTEREGQIEFFDNYCKAESPPSSGEGEQSSPNHGIPWEENDGVLVENCDGVYNGVLFEKFAAGSIVNVGPALMFGFVLWMAAFGVFFLAMLPQIQLIILKILESRQPGE